MRGKKAAINTFFSLFEEFVAIICGFVLPKLILSAFGSKYNGLTTSITQFLSCAIIIRSGIGGATRAALYKPLANNDKNKINSIIKATDSFMKKIGLILAISIIAFSFIYPILVHNQFDYFFTFSLFLIIGISTFAESFFGITYLIILQADQKLWISSLIKSICYIMNTILAFLLIKLNFGIHIVKLASSIVFVLYPILIQLYVRKKYKINLNVNPDNSAISQRWDAFWHQISSFVMSNTDVIILTVFASVLEVSVYSVYNLVINGLKRFISSFSTGLEAAFGNMIAKKQYELLKKNIEITEILLYSTSTIVYTTAIIVILQFVSIYTKGITDANYLRPEFAYILLISQFFTSIRTPYQVVVQAAGHYKQTKKGAIVEPILNIVISLIFVIKYGLIGVAIGTLAATLFRTIQYSMYMSDKIVIRNQFITLKRVFISFVEGFVIIEIAKCIKFYSNLSYISWIINSGITVLISTIVVILGNLVFFKKEFKALIEKFTKIINKRDRKEKYVNQ